MKLRKTKIVATIGPATESRETLVNLVNLGVNVFRLNSSHDELEDHRRRIQILKKIREEKKLPFSILIDLSGPKIRTGALSKEYITLKEGETLILTTEDLLGTEEKISVNYLKFPYEVKSHDKILLNDGAIELEVMETKEKEVITKVIREFL